MRQLHSVDQAAPAAVPEPPPRTGGVDILELCVQACPSQAMQDIYAGKTIHADCFACGACIAACPRDAALGWRKSNK